MKHLVILLSFLMAGLCKAQAPVSAVELNSYSGKWYVVASIPTRFDNDWNYITESYTLKPNGKIAIYTVYQKTSGTRVRHVRSKGFPKAKSQNTLWKVQFVWPFRADYLIEEIGPGYSYAVVGHPKKSYLYILSRQPKLDDSIYRDIVKRYSEKGYATSQMRLVIQ